MEQPDESDVSIEHADASTRFNTIFHAEYRRILAYALRRVHRADDAADVAAETFLVAWRRLSDVPNGDERRLWLYGVARNVLANHRRSTDRQGRLTARLRHVVDEATRPIETETTVTIRDALRQLTDADREVLILSAWEELTPTEIGSVLQISRATARTRLFRARRRLRGVLTQMGFHERQPSDAALTSPLPTAIQEAE